MGQVRRAGPAGGLRGAWWAMLAMVFLACRREAAPPRIAYPYPWLGPDLLRVAQPAIDAWRTPRVVELPESLMAAVTPRQGYVGDVDYALAAAAMPGLVAAVGPQSSRATLLTAPVYAEQQIPFISPTATSHRLSAAGPWVFQLAPDDRVEGAFAVRFLLDSLRLRRVTIFYLTASEYGNGLRQGVVEALAAHGVTPVDQVGIIEQSPFARRVTTSLRRAPPEAVVVAARTPEAAAIARSVHALLPRVPVLVTDGVLVNDVFIRAVGPAAAAVYGIAWWSPELPDTVSRAFVTQWRKVKGVVPSASDAMYYDAIMLAAQAVRDAGPRRDAIRRYLGELGTTRPAYHGVTGLLSFQPNRAINLHVTRIANGAAVLVDWR